MADYQVIYAESITDFDKEVSDWLALGYKPAGGVSYFLGEYHQAVYSYEYSYDHEKKEISFIG